MKSREYYEQSKRLYTTLAELDYSLDVFGDFLAEREGYKELDGMEAIYFYISHKFNWPPAQVKGMKGEDLRLLLSEEMHGWTLPPEAKF